MAETTKSFNNSLFSQTLNCSNYFFQHQNYHRPQNHYCDFISRLKHHLCSVLLGFPLAYCSSVSYNPDDTNCSDVDSHPHTSNSSLFPVPSQLISSGYSFDHFHEGISSLFPYSSISNSFRANQPRFSNSQLSHRRQDSLRSRSHHSPSEYLDNDMLANKNASVHSEAEAFQSQPTRSSCNRLRNMIENSGTAFGAPWLDDAAFLQEDPIPDTHEWIHNVDLFEDIDNLAEQQTFWAELEISHTMKRIVEHDRWVLIHCEVDGERVFNIDWSRQRPPFFSVRNYEPPESPLKEEWVLLHGQEDYLLGIQKNAEKKSQKQKIEVPLDSHVKIQNELSPIVLQEIKSNENGDPKAKEPFNESPPLETSVANALGMPSAEVLTQEGKLLEATSKLVREASYPDLKAYLMNTTFGKPETFLIEIKNNAWVPGRLAKHRTFESTPHAAVLEEQVRENTWKHIQTVWKKTVNDVKNSRRHKYHMSAKGKRRVLNRLLDLLIRFPDEIHHTKNIMRVSVVPVENSEPQDENQETKYRISTWWAPISKLASTYCEDFLD